MTIRSVLFVGVMLLSAQASAQVQAPAPAAQKMSADAAMAHTATAIFAGGCFWSMEAAFEKLPGVITAVSGYTGGRTPDPKYRQLRGGRTGHAEAVLVTYDTSRLSYPALVDYFWHNIDPSVRNGQFCDLGNQYRSAIFYQGEEQRQVAQTSKAALFQSGKFKQIHTEIVAASRFYPAEAYHQDYARKNPSRYNYYRLSCGRDKRLAIIWGTKP